MQHSDSKALATDARTDINKALRQLAKGPPKKGAGCDGTHFYLLLLVQKYKYCDSSQRDPEKGRCL